MESFGYGAEAVVQGYIRSDEAAAATKFGFDIQGSRELFKSEFVFGL